MSFTDFPCVIALAQNVPIPPNHIPLGYSSYDDQPKLPQKGRKQKEVKAPSEKTACTAFQFKGAMRFFLCIICVWSFFIQYRYT